METRGGARFRHCPAALEVGGTPARVGEKVIDNNRRIGGAGVIGIFSYGSMPPELAKANIRLFAEKVLSAFRN